MQHRRSYNISGSALLYEYFRRGYIMEKLKRVVLDGCVVILRVRNSTTELLEDVVFIRDENELEGNNIWKQLSSYRHFAEEYEKTKI